MDENVQIVHERLCVEDSDRCEIFPKKYNGDSDLPLNPRCHGDKSLYFWCRSRDLNPDGRCPLPPQDSVS
ncbi:MAG TPA: hypothetical protein P5244_16345, partial [Syntrophales bacterium]|nr:hypothetical protein [Syntrophales bacterium]